LRFDIKEFPELTCGGLSARSEIDAAAVLFPVAVARRLPAAGTPDFARRARPRSARPLVPALGVFGLAGAVFTNDLGRANRIANALQAGIVWINDYNITPPEVPFGGYKQSGIGRENGLQTIEHYTQLKTIYTNLGDVPPTY